MRLLSMFRVLLPSWRFFDGVGGSPTLLVRSGVSADELGPWREVLLAAPRTACSLFIHAHGNLALAHQTLLEQLVSDVAELDDRVGPEAAADAVPELVSYRLVTRLARAHLLAGAAVASAAGAAGRSRFQFKLTVLADTDGPAVLTHRADVEAARAEDVLVSQLHEA